VKGGYVGKILRVNLSTKEIRKESLPPDLARRFLGGVGLGSYLLYREVPPGADPLGEANKLFFCTGPLTGTRIPTGRYVVVFKSPLTSILGWSSSAGHWGPELKFAGYDVLVVEGVSPQPVYLWIDDDFVELRPAAHLWGTTTSLAQKKIREELGDEEVRVAAIGPAGERLVRFASIINDEGRAAGRAGAGAVMGSKKLKAVAVRGHGGVGVADPERVSEVVKRMYEVWRSEPFVRSLHLYGTDAMTSFTSGIAAFPTRNFQSGWFEEWEKLSGPTLSKTLLVKKVGCFGCPIACGRVSLVRSGPHRGMVVWGPEYEHVNTFGAGCGNSDLEIVSVCHQLVNEYGMDGITCGRAISFAMECYEKGILKKEEADGLDLSWGNRETLVELVKRIGERRGIGDLLAEGTRRAAQRLGRGAERYAMQTKGLEYAGYEPRGMKGMALTYALGNRGGCHITTGMLYLDIGTMTWMYPLDSPLDPQVLDLEKVKAEVALERRYTVVESAVLCKFFAGIVFTPEMMASSLSAVTGWEMDAAEVDRLGERIWTLQRLFNVREGISRKDDTLPDRFFTEPLPDGFSQGQVLDRKTFEEMLDAYYGMVGWDRNGIPTREKVRELGLEELLA
jgi:aldehyde:ferredoxin oxidoreductase